jgi:hypothetical protein
MKFQSSGLCILLGPCQTHVGAGLSGTQDKFFANLAESFGIFRLRALHRKGTITRLQEIPSRGSNA